MLKKALIDASSAILLFKADLIADLFRCYAIHMTPFVYEELTRKGYPGSDQFVGWRALKSYIVCPPVDSGAKLCAMGPGESQTLLTYRPEQFDFIIVDDKKAATFCRKNAIPYINALLYPRILYLGQMISEEAYQGYAKKIVQTGRYSPKILEFGLTCPAEAILLFLP